MESYVATCWLENHPEEQHSAFSQGWKCWHWNWSSLCSTWFRKKDFRLAQKFWLQPLSFKSYLLLSALVFKLCFVLMCFLLFFYLCQLQEPLRVSRISGWEKLCCSWCGYQCWWSSNLHQKRQKDFAYQCQVSQHFFPNHFLPEIHVFVKINTEYI